MEYTQYRKWHRRQVTRGAAAAGLVAAVASYAGSYALDRVAELGRPGWDTVPLLDVPANLLAQGLGNVGTTSSDPDALARALHSPDIPVTLLLLLVSLAAFGLVIAAERAGTTPGAQRRRVRHAAGWVTGQDLRRYSGTRAARSSARTTRPSLSTRERWSQPVSALGVPLGVIQTGSAWVRSRTLTTGFEKSALLVGEPGTFKSTLVANMIMDFPGPAVVVSPKVEYWTGLSELRARTTGPVRTFDPASPDPIPAELQFRWNMVRGCRDAQVAQDTAFALMSAAAGGGLTQADFWKAKGRGLLTALLAAADLDGATLRDVASWMQREDYERPAAVLRHFSDQVEPTLLGFVDQVTDSSAQSASGSVSHTASSVLEFLASPAVADALAPSDEDTDVAEMLDARGTLFLVTQGNAAMAPLMVALTNHITRTVKQRNRERGRRQDPPLGLFVDEAHLTMPSVPLHEYAARLRSEGVWMCVAVQNYAQIVEKWGREAAHTLRSSLQTLVVTGAHDEEDRERYSKRVGQRTERHVTDSAPKDKAAGPLRSLSTAGNASVSTTQVPILPPEQLGQLREREALVMPNKGAAAIVRFAPAWDVAARRLTALQRKATREQERAASREAAAARARVRRQAATETTAATATETVAEASGSEETR